MNRDLSKTQFINMPQEVRLDAGEVIEQAYHAMVEKKYNPVSQIVGYIMSGDPTYITSYKGARTLITKLERDELIEELVKNYIETKLS
ncbi:MAG: IreB family regulatory phosphoprotein [Lachnospiraceae bacterium]